MAPATPAAQFAANVRRSREARDRTKEEAAWACHLHPSAFGRIEAGERKPTLETIFRLAAGLEVPPAESLPESTDAPRWGVAARLP